MPFYSARTGEGVWEKMIYSATKDSGDLPMAEVAAGQGICEKHREKFSWTESRPGAHLRTQSRKTY